MINLCWIKLIKDQAYNLVILVCPGYFDIPTCTLLLFDSFQLYAYPFVSHSR